MTHRKMILRTFAIGLVLGVSAAYSYATYVEQSYVFGSVELFQTMAIFAFCAFVAPMARVSVALLLAGLERGEETAEVLKSIKDDAGPLIADMKQVASDFKGMNTGRAAEFLEKLSKDATFERLATAVERMVEKFEAKVVGKMIENI